MQETKEVELGGGWSATIIRPPHWSTNEWFASFAKRNGAAAKLVEYGHDVPVTLEPVVEDPKASSNRLRIFEEQVLPNAVLSFKNPEGLVLQTAQVHAADLGYARFTTLGNAIVEFIGEADAWFRDEAGQPLAGTSPDVGASSEGAG